jgi:hypothetical protein
MLFAMTRLRLLGALLIGATLAVLLALVAFSPAAQANHSWNNYHWARTSNPFTLTLGDNVTPAWDSYLDAASGPATPFPDASENDWSDSSVLDTTIADPGGTTRRKCRPTSGRVEVCNYTYGNNGWLGLAQIWVSGGHILQGTTKVNDTYYNTAKYNTPAWRHLVMCQEVGHTFGLDHTDETNNNPNLGSCMDYTNDPDGGTGGAVADDPSNEHPGGDDPTTTSTLEIDHDYDELETIYTHTDLRTTVGSTGAASTLPPAANQGNFNSKSEWGHKIKESPNGKLELWERDFRGKAKLFTWVIEAS